MKQSAKIFFIVFFIILGSGVYKSHAGNSNCSFTCGEASEENPCDMWSCGQCCKVGDICLPDVVGGWPTCTCTPATPEECPIAGLGACELGSACGGGGCDVGKKCIGTEPDQYCDYSDCLCASPAQCVVANGSGYCPFPVWFPASGGVCLDAGYVCCVSGDDDYVPPITSGSYPDFDYGGVRFSDLQAIITPIAKILYYTALVVGVIFIIYSGYMIMTSEGNPQRVQQGQEQLTAAILGITFILLSAAILRVIITSILGA